MLSVRVARNLFGHCQKRLVIFEPTASSLIPGGVDRQPRSHVSLLVRYVRRDTTPILWPRASGSHQHARSGRRPCRHRAVSGRGAGATASCGRNGGSSGTGGRTGDGGDDGGDGQGDGAGGRNRPGHSRTATTSSLLGFAGPLRTGAAS
jgi:hypothetical protein